MKRFALLLILPIALGGCIAKTAVDIVTLPVKAASKSVDLATTSQSEADEKRGREIRKQEEAEGKAARKREKAAREAAERGETPPEEAVSEPQ